MSANNAPGNTANTPNNIGNNCPAQIVVEAPELPVKQAVLRTIFGATAEPLQSQDEDNWKEYFDFYGAETETIYSGAHPQLVKRYARDHVKTHQDVCRLMSGLLGESSNLNRAQLKNKVRDMLHHSQPNGILVAGQQHGPQQQAANPAPGTGPVVVPQPTTIPDRETGEDHILDSLLRLLFMININKALETGTETVTWAFSDQRPLKTFIKDTFPASQGSKQDELGGSNGHRLHPFFTAAFMERICGLQLEWTDSLEDHLRLYSYNTRQRRQMQHQQRAGNSLLFRWFYGIWSFVGVGMGSENDKTRVLRVFGHKRWLLAQIDAQKAAEAAAAAAAAATTAAATTAAAANQPAGTLQATGAAAAAVPPRPPPATRTGSTGSTAGATGASVPVTPQTAPTHPNNPTNLTNNTNTQQSPPTPFKLPLRLLEDTVATLDLLFPYEDEPTKKLCNELGWRFHWLGGGARRRLNVAGFRYWRGRLQELNEDVFLAPAASWKQLFFDKRNPQQYWTFWIAIIILGLTVLSTLASLVQAVYSVLAYYKPG